MNGLIWTLQVFLAGIFLLSGACKVSLTKAKLVAMGQTGVGPLPMPLVRFGAACELVGVVGIIAPWASGIAPLLTPIAAVGFAVIMVVAIGSHAYLREPLATLFTTAILAASVLVAVIRFGGL